MARLDLGRRPLVSPERPTVAESVCGRLRAMLGEQEAMVLEVKPWDVHGVGYVDVTVVFPDRTMETARLGSESVPAGLAKGERVLVTRAVNVVVAMRRTKPSDDES